MYLHLCIYIYICVCMVYIHVVCAILLSSFSTYANANGGQQKKGQSSNKKRSTQQKLKVIKNANLMLLLPDSLTLCALTVVSQCVVLCRVASCLVSCLFCLAFSFALGPQIVAVIIRCRCRCHCLAGRFYLWHKTGNDLCKMADAQLI